MRDILSFVQFGNINIFDIYVKHMKEKEYANILSISFETNGTIRIIKRGYWLLCIDLLHLLKWTGLKTLPISTILKGRN